MTQLIVARHPLTDVGREWFQQAELRPGEDLESFVSRHGVDVAQPGWLITISGAEVPPEQWARTRPKEGQIIECRRVPGRDAVKLLATVALTYYTFGAGASAFGLGAGSFGAFAVNAGLYMLGTAVINRVLRAPQARLTTYEQVTGSTYSLNGGRNRARPYEPLGLLFGTTKVVPDFNAQPYSWFEGDNQFQSVRLSAGVNTASVDTLKIGQTPISSYEDVTVQKVGFPTGDTEFTDWANVDTTAGGLLDAPTGPGAWVTRTSSVDAIQVSLDFVANIYSVADDGAMVGATVTINVETRLLPSGSWVARPDVVIYSKSTAPQRRTVNYSFGGVPQQVEVRCRKQNTNVTSTRAANAVEWASLKSYQEDATNFASYPQVGLRIRASGQLNGTLDEVSWVGTAAPIPLWDGSAWTTVATSNPGAHILQFFRGIFDDDGRLQAGMGLPDSQIDIEGLKAFMVHCTANGYEFNHWFDAPLSCLEMVEAIAALGLGSFSMHTGKHGVVWLASSEPLGAVVNMAKMKPGSFRVDYAARELADELEVAFFDADDGYASKSLRLLAPGVTAPRETARLAPMGANTEAAAARMGRLVMAQNIYGRKAVTWAMDLEHLCFRRYSVVALSHDLTQWGYGGRLKAAAVDSGGVVTLTLDEPVPANAVRHVGLHLPGESGYRVFGVAAFTGTTTTLVLSEPWPSGPGSGDPPLPGSAAGNPAHDTIWIYDFQAQPGKRLRVTSVEPTPDLTGAVITATPEPDEFWTYMASGAYTVSGAPAVAAGTSASNLHVSQRRLDVNYGNGTELTLTFDVAGQFASAQVWVAPDGQALQLLGSTVVPRFGPFVVGNDGVYAIEVRPFDTKGRAGPVLAATYSVTLGGIVGGNKIVRVYKRSLNIPSTPTGDGIPAGWSASPVAADGNRLWFSEAEQTIDGVLVTSWSVPIVADATPGPAVVNSFGEASAVHGVGSGAATAGVKIMSNGEIHVRQGAGSYVPSGLSWYLPEVSGIGSSHWVRVRLLSGATPSVGTLDTWQAISGEPAFEVSRSTVGETLSLLKIQISNSSGGSPILGSGQAELDAIRF